jgi:hypothetical protein
MSDDKVIVIKKQLRVSGQVEITKSFGYKLQCEKYSGVKDYESRDFFCAHKVSCDADDAVEMGRLVYQFCEDQVMEDVTNYIAKLRRKAERKTA